MAETAADIITFWTSDVGEANWYRQDDVIDQKVRHRFQAMWSVALENDAAPFSGTAEGALASTIALDQFPRNMFRDDPRAFATDPLARRTVRAAIADGFDRAIDMPLRQFMYMPFTHSEVMEDQLEGAAYIEHGIGRTETLRHALAHAEIIRRFGRFPFRNNALGRETTVEEQAFLDGGGYASIVRGIEV